MVGYPATTTPMVSVGAARPSSVEAVPPRRLDERPERVVEWTGACSTPHEERLTRSEARAHPRRSTCSRGGLRRATWRSLRADRLSALARKVDTSEPAPLMLERPRPLAGCASPASACPRASPIACRLPASEDVRGCVVAAGGERSTLSRVMSIVAWWPNCDSKICIARARRREEPLHEVRELPAASMSSVTAALRSAARLPSRSIPQIGHFTLLAHRSRPCSFTSPVER